MAKRSRSKHKAPMLFGMAMRRVWQGENSFEWAARYGWLTAWVRESQPSPDRPAELSWFVTAQGHRVAGGDAVTLNQAAQRIETALREVGKALPAAALVSRKEWRLTNG